MATLAWRPWSTCPSSPDGVRLCGRSGMGQMGTFSAGVQMYDTPHVRPKVRHPYVQKCPGCGGAASCQRTWITSAPELTNGLSVNKDGTTEPALSGLPFGTGVDPDGDPATSPWVERPFPVIPIATQGHPSLRSGWRRAIRGWTTRWADRRIQNEELRWSCAALGRSASPSPRRKWPMAVVAHFR
jgi:hypothetical protein